MMGTIAASGKRESFTLSNISQNDSAIFTTEKGGSDEAVVSTTFVNDIGSKIYIGRFIDQQIAEYDLSSNHDINSTWTLQGVCPAIGYPFTNFTFNSTGTKVYLVDYTNNLIKSYNLSVAEDITTMSGTVNNSLALPTNTYIRDCVFNHDGTTLYTVYEDGGILYIGYWDLSTGYDLSTAGSITSESIDSVVTFASSISYARIEGNDYIFIYNSSSPNVFAFVNGVSSSDFDESESISNLTGGVTSISPSYIYSSERTGAGPSSYIWTLYQFITGI